MKRGVLKYKPSGLGVAIWSNLNFQEDRNQSCFIYIVVNLLNFTIMEVQYFKAQNNSNRYRKGQKVWIRLNCANHLITYHKWRGSGRYVEGTIDKFSPLVGEIKTIEVNDDFAERISKI